MLFKYEDDTKAYEEAKFRWGETTKNELHENKCKVLYLTQQNEETLRLKAQGEAGEESK